MKTKTHIQIAAENRLSVGEELLEMTRISDFDRKEMIYAAGLVFLNEVYPRNNAMLLPMNEKLERNANFWKWWRQEWYQWEQDYLCFITEHQVKLTAGLYANEMAVMPHDRITEQSFQMFLKIFKDRL